MKELLEALQSGNTRTISMLAMDLLLTGDNKLNKAQVNEFEKYAPCKIHETHGDHYIGYIEYNHCIYSFG